MTLDIDEVNNYLSNESGMQLESLSAEHLELGFARCRYSYDTANTRPGGYISGPTIMALVDVSVWVAVFTRAGITPMAVTWDLHVSFLRPAIGRDLLADAKLLKFGRLTYATVDVYHEDDKDRPVAHSTVTYALPPTETSTRSASDARAASA
jgi:uncharacterized protein (TIGR00369 family)